MDKTRKPIGRMRNGFDVTCVVGTVTFGDGDKSPYQCALSIIADHGADGTFTFPAEDGRTVTVTIEHA